MRNFITRDHLDRGFNPVYVGHTVDKPIFYLQLQCHPFSVDRENLVLLVFKHLATTAILMDSFSITNKNRIREYRNIFSLFFYELSNI